MSKYFMYGTELQELEQMMMLVPNFMPRRSGVIIVKKLQNKNESIRCIDCNYFIGSQCSKNICSCFTERLEAGMICYETIVKNCYKEFKSYHFKRRLARLVRNFDGDIFINPIHRFRFYKVCRIQNVSMENRNPSYLAVLFLLTAEKYNIKKMDYITNDNPFAGKVICGCCGSTFGRKVWNSTEERLKRTIWQCNSKYKVKGKIGCRNRHINDEILYETFVYAFNEIVKNIDYYMTKWQKQIKSKDILERVTSKRFIEIFKEAQLIEKFDAGLYFKLVEMAVVYEDGVSMGLLDGTEINCE